MIGLQEIISKTEPQRSAIERYMDTHNSYDPSEISLYAGIKRSMQREIRESIRQIPLAHMIREFLIDGLAGAGYLIPTKLADIFFTAAEPIDLAPLVSAEMINGWPGGDLTIDIPERYSLSASYTASGGERPLRTPTTSQATISPVQFSAALVADSSMLEDSQYNLTEWYAKIAAQSIAMQSNDLLLADIKASADGVGTQNSGNAGAGTTLASHVLGAVDSVGQDRWSADTLIITPEAWEDAVGYGVVVAAANYWIHPIGVGMTPVAKGFDAKYQMLDVAFNTSPELHASTDVRGAAFLGCVSLILDRSAAVITGRKRWMLMENYSDPVKDLAGLVVSCRQASITPYNDASFELTET